MKGGTFLDQGALPEMAGSVFQHRNLKGEGKAKKIFLIIPIHKGSGVGAAGRSRRGRPGFRGGSRGPRAQPNQARGPARGGADTAAPRPAPRAQAPPAAQARREARQTQRRRPLQVAPASGRRLSGGRALRPGPGGGVAISAEGNGSRGAKVLEEKEEKNRLQTAPRAVIRLPPGHAASVQLGWAPRVPAAVPNASGTSRGRDRRLRRRRPAATAAGAET